MINFATVLSGKYHLFGDIYDAVIYDENEGFSCVDETIDNTTPYLRMSQDTFEKFNQYAK